MGELPESQGYNAISVKTDQFTKVQYYIPESTSWTAADVANAYICYIWKLYGLPRHITSDHRPQFASLFAKESNKKLDIGLCLSTPYHTQKDGLSEWAIQTVKQYLRIFYHNRQNRWTVWLDWAQFPYNTTKAIHGYVTVVRL